MERNDVVHPARETAAHCSVRRPDRDMALQLAMLRTAISRHAAELAPLLVTDAAAGRVASAQHGQCLLFKDKALEHRLASLKGQGEKLLEAELKKALQLGAVRMLATPPSPDALDQLTAAFPHFGPVLELVRQRAALAEITPGRVFSLPAILLAGEPGVGKTAFCEALASALKLPTRRVDMAAATAGFVLSGSHASWASGRPGAIWSLLQSPSAAGLLLLDEIDKACDGNYPPVGPLYALLERSSAGHFMDECIEIEVDASNLMVLATCNDASKIESALRSRFTEFEIASPEPEQMVAIARSVYRTLRQRAAWGSAFPEELDLRAAEELSDCTPRQMAAILESAVAHAAAAGRKRIEPAGIRYALAMRQSPTTSRRRVGFI
ncbi:MAG: AAA family ATPase [Burkholderiaceae bacterium]|nr:AAA family ATPase [Burkholderiaceae bacterium]